MKLTFTFIIIFFICPTNSFSQKKIYIEVNSKSGISRINGEKTVVGYSDLIGDQQLPSKVTIGYQFGVKGGYHFTDNLSSEVSFLYSKQGQYYENISVTDNIYGEQISLEYLKIPLTLNYLIKLKNDLSLSFSSGFYFGLLTDFAVKETFNEWTLIFNNVDNKLYKNDFGVLFETGIEKSLISNLSIKLMLNYELGLRDIRNLSAVFPGSNRKYFQEFRGIFSPKTTNTFLGFTIGLKKYFW